MLTKYRASFGGLCGVRKRTGYTPQQGCILPPHLHLEADEALPFSTLAVNGNRCLAGVSHDWTPSCFPENITGKQRVKQSDEDDGQHFEVRVPRRTRMGSMNPLG
jgi:hypothetical protein